jgi:hypothetical protein
MHVASLFLHLSERQHEVLIVHGVGCIGVALLTDLGVLLR